MTCKKCVYRCEDGKEYSFVGEVGLECGSTHSFNGEQCQFVREEEPTEEEQKKYCGGWT